MSLETFEDMDIDVDILVPIFIDIYTGSKPVEHLHNTSLAIFWVANCSKNFI